MVLAGGGASARAADDGLLVPDALDLIQSLRWPGRQAEVSRDSQHVIQYLGNDTFLARRSPGL